MIVVDASALVVATADTTARGQSALEAVGGGGSAPHLADAELGQAFRAMVLRRELPAEPARRSFDAATALIVERFPHTLLRERAWDLRRNVSFYDGLYVALAELLGVALVTADRRMARSRRPRCDIVVV